MKREVWVECESKEKNRMEVKNTWNNILMYFKPETLHESRWIPVSERMPDKPGHYHVVRLDREDWAMLLLSDAKCGAPGFYYWNHSNVTHWLETPPLPVTEEVEPTDERFEQWYDYTRSVIRTENATSKQFMKFLYESARREDIKPVPVEDEFEKWYKEKFPVIDKHFGGSNHYEICKESWNAGKESKCA